MNEIETKKTVKLKASLLARRQYKDQDIARFLSSMPPWLLFITVLIICMLLDSLGGWVGNLRHNSGARESESALGTAVAAMLGLLAFILAFTFSLTWTRFANRNFMVSAQAKAIETCYLQTSIIPDKQQIAIRRLFKEYVAVLLEFPDVTNVNKTIERVDDLQLKIWAETASIKSEDLEGDLFAMFISSVNQVITTATERKTLVMVFVIPDAIWGCLLFLSGIGMFAFGYQSGMSGIHNFLQFPLLPVAFGLVIVLISELNSTDMQSLFRVKREPLEFVQHLMERMP